MKCLLRVHNEFQMRQMGIKGGTLDCGKKALAQGKPVYVGGPNVKGQLSIEDLVRRLREN